MKLRTILLVSLLIAITFNMIQGIRSVSLDDLREQDAQLDRALNYAASQSESENGHTNTATTAATPTTRPLLTVLTQRNIYERRLYIQAAHTSLKLPKTDAGTDRNNTKNRHGGQDVNYIRRFYLKKYLFMPFVHISTGNDATDRALDNEIAYALVAGCQQPTPRDLQHARIILKRLEAYIAHNKDIQILDTVGCIYFVTGAFTEAAQAFTTALNELPNSDLESADKAYLHTLFSQRKEAAEAKSSSLPLEWDTDTIQ